MERKTNLGIDLVATGKRIRRAMNRKGYTTQMIASMLEVTYQSVWKWCKGETIPDVENLLILSRILDTSMDNLVVCYDFLHERIANIMAIGNEWLKVFEYRQKVGEEKRCERMTDCMMRQRDEMFALLEYGPGEGELLSPILEYYKCVSL